MLLAAVYWGLVTRRLVAGSLVDRIRVLKTLGLLPTHWRVKTDPGVSAGLLTAELVPGG